VYQGFVRDAKGKVSTFKAPGAGTGGHQGTVPISINIAGAIAGTSLDAGFGFHGFERAATGKITSFAANDQALGTAAFSINAAGDITGAYSDASGVAHGFLRAPNGTITTFKAPGAGTGGLQGTGGLSINAARDITGTYLDASNVFHGFLRTP
jgi:uncharacterized membrane protein